MSPFVVNPRAEGGSRHRGGGASVVRSERDRRAAGLAGHCAHAPRVAAAAADIRRDCRYCAQGTGFTDLSHVCTATHVRTVTHVRKHAHTIKHIHTHTNTTALKVPPATFDLSWYTWARTQTRTRAPAHSNTYARTQVSFRIRDLQ